MTGNELIQELMAFGAKRNMTYEFEIPAAYVAINRAISEVNRLFPMRLCLSLIHNPPRPALWEKGITIHKGGEDIEFEASDVKSLAFDVSGSGSAVLTAEDGSGRAYTFEWQDAVQFTTMRGFVAELLSESVEENDQTEYGDKADIKLRFTGEFSYMIRNLTVYDEIRSDDVEDIEPKSSFTAYDFKRIKYAGSRFISFDHIEDVGVSDYKIDDSILYLSNNIDGVYNVSYRATPLEVNADNLSFPIDIDEEIQPLISLRAAFYLYLIIDPEVSAACNQEYLRMLADYKKIRRVKTPSKFRDIRGF